MISNMKGNVDSPKPIAQAEGARASKKKQPRERWGSFTLSQGPSSLIMSHINSQTQLIVSEMDNRPVTRSRKLNDMFTMPKVISKMLPSKKSSPRTNGDQPGSGTSIHPDSTVKTKKPSTATRADFPGTPVKRDSTVKTKIPSTATRADLPGTHVKQDSSVKTKIPSTATRAKLPGTSVKQDSSVKTNKFVIATRVDKLSTSIRQDSLRRTNKPSTVTSQSSAGRTPIKSVASNSINRATNSPKLSLSPLSISSVEKTTKSSTPSHVSSINTTPKHTAAANRVNLAKSPAPSLTCFKVPPGSMLKVSMNSRRPSHQQSSKVLKVASKVIEESRKVSTIVEESPNKRKRNPNPTTTSAKKRKQDCDMDIRRLMYERDERMENLNQWYREEQEKCVKEFEKKIAAVQARSKRRMADKEKQMEDDLVDEEDKENMNQNNSTTVVGTTALTTVGAKKLPGLDHTIQPIPGQHSIRQPLGPLNLSHLRLKPPSMRSSRSTLSFSSVEGSPALGSDDSGRSLSQSMTLAAPKS